MIWLLTGGVVARITGAPPTFRTGDLEAYRKFSLKK
jgi:hypothetical protein